MKYKVQITASDSGRVGKIIEVNAEGEETVLCTERASTFKNLSRKLRKTGFIPTNVVLKKRGVTIFIS